MAETLRVSCLFLWILVAALLFSSVYDGLGAVKILEPLFLSLGNPVLVLVMMQASFIAMGTFLDDTAMLLIVAPLYIPIVATLGYDLIWYGVLYVITCEMAYLTPPFGYTLFIMRGIVPKEITMGDIYRSVIPFVIIQGVCLALVFAFPQIALWLPNLIMGG
jgi:TRAP-type mannitol/chloroaromatic compound transport system permease large subunit